MRVDWILLARYAETTADGTMNVLGAGLDTLLFARGTLPAAGDLYVAMRLVAPMQQWRESGHVMSTFVVTPDGERHKGHRIPLREPRLPSPLHLGADPGLLLTLPHAMTFATVGSYSIDIVVDDKKLHTSSILVHVPDAGS